jgi:hypothetical protein
VTLSEARPTGTIGFSAEQEQLRTAVRIFPEEKSPESQVRRLMEAPEGYDQARRSWRDTPR